jgi:hypothetical protein
VIDDQRDAIAWAEIRERARWSGLELSDEDALDLLPYHNQQRRWLETLRRVLGEEEEPVTECFAAGSSRWP